MFIRYVLDDEEPADHKLGETILDWFKSRGFDVGLNGQVRVIYEALPPCSDRMFLGNLEGARVTQCMHPRFTLLVRQEVLEKTGRNEAISCSTNIQMLK